MQVSRNPRTGTSPSADFCIQMVPPVIMTRTRASGVRPYVSCLVRGSIIGSMFDGDHIKFAWVSWARLCKDQYRLKREVPLVWSAIHEVMQQTLTTLKVLKKICYRGGVAGKSSLYYSAQVKFLLDGGQPLHWFGVFTPLASSSIPSQRRSARPSLCFNRSSRRQLFFESWNL